MNDALRSAGWMIKNAMGQDKMSRAIARHLDGIPGALDKMPTLRAEVDGHIDRINKALDQ